MNKKEVVTILKKGGIGVFPTDTLYGLVGSALKQETVERIYRVRKRNPVKPFIILLSSVSELRRFNIRPDRRIRGFLETVWPGPVSVVLDCPGHKFKYLHRGTQSLAFRIPASQSLRALLKRTGPLVAPTANTEGEPPAQTIREAQDYFGAGADFYFGTIRKTGEPSTLIRILR